MGELLPAEVVTAEALGEHRVDPALFPEEEPYVAGAVEKRRREFTAGRSCARQALAGLGIPAVAVLPGPRREPRWPAGVIGSLTHCQGYSAAAVAYRGTVAALGIDAEPDMPMPEGVLEQVAGMAELEGLSHLPVGVNWGRLLFSAKESVYKAWYPATGRWLGFEDVHVDFCPVSGSWTARLLVPEPIAAFRGRFLSQEGLLLTAVAPPVPRSGSWGHCSPRLPQIRA